MYPPFKTPPTGHVQPMEFTEDARRILTEARRMAEAGVRDDMPAEDRPEAVGRRTVSLVDEIEQRLRVPGADIVSVILDMQRELLEGEITRTIESVFAGATGITDDVREFCVRTLTGSMSRRLTHLFDR